MATPRQLLRRAGGPIGVRGPPAAGEQLVIGEFRVVVEKVHKRRVLRVYFERLEAAPKVPVAEEVK